MKIKTLILVALLPLFLTACRPKPNINVQVPQAKPKSVAGTILELMEQKKPLKCKYNKHIKEDSFEGVIYISGAKVRNEITMPNNEKIVKKSIGILLGNVEYVWFDGDSSGMKYDRTPDLVQTTQSAPEEEDITEEEVIAQTEGVVEEYAYGCEEWNPDESYYSIPENIKFYDYEYLRDGLQKALCKKCNEESPYNRSVCIKSLNIKCN